jgi:hypothetical protein
MKHPLLKGAALAAALIISVVLVTFASPPAPVSATGVPSGPTNATAALVTNATSVCVIPIPGGPAGVTSPTPLAIWPYGGGVSAGSSTNTFTFANSYDGVTLVNTNTWTVTLVCNNGTNVATGYAYINPTNFTGARGFGLLSITIGNTNGFTNDGYNVSWPY